MCACVPTIRIPTYPGSSRSASMGGVTSLCRQCGRPLSEHNRHVRFRLPDPVAALSDWEQTEGLWSTHPDPNVAVMMQVPNVAPFIRCMLPVTLTGGYGITFGVWVAVHPDDLQRAFAVWWSDDYVHLQLSGHLASALPGWGLLRAPVVAKVQHPDETPYITASDDDELARVLHDVWAHDEVLPMLPT